MSAQNKLIYGIRPVMELLHTTSSVKVVWFEQEKQHESLEEMKSLCRKKGIKSAIKSARYLDKLCSHSLHQGVAALYIPPELEIAFEKANSAPRSEWWLCLYLDQIQDPHNFGAIVRSAENFAVDQIFYPEHHNAPFNPVAFKTSAGAGIHNPPYKISSVSNMFDKFKTHSFEIVGALPEEGTLISETDFKKNMVLVIGNEGEGITGKIKKYCTAFVRIPAYGKVASLNASVSAGIMLYEIQRQRQKK
ncbi:MAG: 23S rRNA (guanosine(2251)-2'-O)-methyltransferase RlmB [Candidatus Aureabacteria bacterium]|nr:23S rRNA (guanosine(2251)-2'-O)-methyltransferase RlmB [Candidatus Auribacterota bacterium]